MSNGIKFLFRWQSSGRRWEYAGIFSRLVCEAAGGGGKRRRHTGAAPLARRRGRVLTVRQGNLELTAALGEGKTELRAPDGSGGMERRVGECLEGEASYRLSRSGRVLFEYESRRASFELEKS